MGQAVQPGNEHPAAGQLALELMHEIRNPLETLSHLTYLTLREADDPAKVRHYMGMAEEQVSMLSRLASQTLGYARSSEHPKPNDLVQLMEAAVRIHQKTINRRKIHLVKHLPEELVAEVHPGEMLQVLSNLIVNALDALPESGVLNLRLRKCQGKVQLIVADNGHGIRREHQESIFEPYFTTKGDGGNGLGLSLTKRLVEHHKGTIRVRSSVAPGRSGSAFRVCLPAGS